MITSFAQAREYIKKDYEKINGNPTVHGIIKSLLFEAGFKYIFWMRLAQYFYVKKKSFRFPFFIISRLFLKHYSYKYGFDISYKTEIREGFSISHFGYVIIGGNVKIGRNCWVKPGLCIGKKHIDSHSKGPVIGDNVKIGVGATILGDITIGDNVSIGANSVVLKDVPDDCIVAGVPAKIIRDK